MGNKTLYTMLDVVFMDTADKVQYIATPGQCYLYSHNIRGLQNMAAGVWVYSGVQLANGKIMLDNAGGAYTAFELELLQEKNHPVGYPGGLRMCYSHTAYEAARALVQGEAKFPMFVHCLGVADYTNLHCSSKTVDYIPRLPRLYARYTNEAARTLKCTDNEIVSMFEGTSRRVGTFIRTPIPVLLEPFPAIAKRLKMKTRDCISAWNIAFHNAASVVGQELFLGWDPDPTYPTKQHRVTRAAYEEYKNDPSCGFITPRVKVKHHANFKDPLRHIDRYRADIDTAIRVGNALHVKPTTLY